MIWYSDSKYWKKREICYNRIYVSLEKNGGLDNLRKSIVRMDVVSSGVERITNPGFPECLELLQWLLIGFHLF